MKIRLLFCIFEFHKVVYQHIADEMEIFVCSREFFYESPGETILKITPYLPKLLSNIKGYTFFGTQCSYLREEFILV